MKIKLLSLGLVFLLLISVGCKKTAVGAAASVSCQNKTDDYSAAVSAFVGSPSNGTCTTLKNALQAVVKSCTGAFAVNVQAYEDIDCSQF